jgi:aldehyde dehydrogenase (NAD+)
LFGPITCLYRATSFGHAIELANATPFGLTACIHTRSFDRGLLFCERVRAGVTVINAGTHGSEAHMPFGGRGLSGNGSREPGTEALDVYSELKNIALNVDPAQV